ncbi:MAG: PhzF family phenazine biosynthesis protein [Alphaproteobacteria bacterium]|nr:PhzF family phenazine biosynthesis protein [Alphaproteobacteria bacterium]
MKLPLYQLDAFAGAVFAGNPAAVCPLKEWLPEATMQAIAAENNLAETAFFVGAKGSYAIRWFTPAIEADLCGHATLASAAVVMTHLEPGLEKVTFSTRRAGDLYVARDGERYVLDFPAWPAKPVVAPDGLDRALGARPTQVLSGKRDYLCVFADAATVKALKPDMAALKRLEKPVVATAPGDAGGPMACDFVSRFFAPSHGIDEDPVTGSAHCMLTPYWAERLGKTSMTARQVSPRGGELAVALKGGRVAIGGRVAPYLEGTIHV